MASGVGLESLGTGMDLPSTQDHMREEIGMVKVFFLSKDLAQLLLLRGSSRTDRK